MNSEYREKEGGVSARAVINGIDISQHEGLCRVIVNRFRWAIGQGGIERDDLLQAARIGIHAAARKFDHSRGLQFSTYATWWVRHEVLREIQNNRSTIRIPVWAQEESRKKTLPPDFIMPSTCSLDNVDAEGNSWHGRFPDADATPPDARLEQEATRVELAELMRCLTPRERDIVRRRMGSDRRDGATYREIAAEHGLISRERIRQVLKAIYEKMQRAAALGES